MIRGLLNGTAPVIASAGLYGVTEGELGKTLLIIMALAVIANQLWAIIEKILKAVRPPQSDLSDLPDLALCEQRHQHIEAELAAIKNENLRQDAVNKEQFQSVASALGELKREFREDVKGLHKRSDDVLRAVSRLEGRVS